MGLGLRLLGSKTCLNSQIVTGDRTQNVFIGINCNNSPS